MKVKLIWITPDAEKHIMYCARVSNPANQDSDDTRLLSYCMKHGHWSIFEMASMCVEIETTRMISAQLLRHKSFSFQEFSQRYAESTDYELIQARRQDEKNRQNSIDDLSITTQAWFSEAQQDIWFRAVETYKHALSLGIAKECARAILPMQTSTKLYMSSTIRSWIHYLQLRCDESTQKEHRDIANEIKLILCEQCPTIANKL